MTFCQEVSEDLAPRLVFLAFGVDNGPNRRPSAASGLRATLVIVSDRSGALRSCSDSNLSRHIDSC